MSRHSFPTSPGATGEQRKFINPTQGFVGANKFGPDGKPTAVPVEPGGEVWLTEEEERMTAEAPRQAGDNPFVKEWDEIVEYDAHTLEPTRTVRRTGTLVLSEEPPRPVASDRYIPQRAEGFTEETTAIKAVLADEELTIPELEAKLAKLRAEKEEPEEAPEVVGAPDVPEQPPVEGQPSPDEIVGTPEAKAANDEALAKREPTAEQRVKEGLEAAKDMAADDAITIAQAEAEQSGAIPV